MEYRKSTFSSASMVSILSLTPYTSTGRVRVYKLTYSIHKLFINDSPIRSQAPSPKTNNKIGRLVNHFCITYSPSLLYTSFVWGWVGSGYNGLHVHACTCRKVFYASYPPVTHSNWPMRTRATTNLLPKISNKKNENWLVVVDCWDFSIRDYINFSIPFVLFFEFLLVLLFWLIDTKSLSCCQLVLFYVLLLVRLSLFQELCVLYVSLTHWKFWDSQWTKIRGSWPPHRQRWWPHIQLMGPAAEFSPVDKFSPVQINCQLSTTKLHKNRLLTIRLVQLPLLPVVLLLPRLLQLKFLPS